MDENRQFRELMHRHERGIDNNSLTASKRTRFCAYNQTGHRFISNEVEVAVASEGNSEDRFSSLLPGSGTAVWIVPIRGLSVSSFFVPVDLLYLDEACAVLAMVESFPVSCVDSSIAKAASILVLPEHSILTMGIDAGDQLLLCSPEDMQRYLMSVHTPFLGPGSNLPARDQRIQLAQCEQQFQEVSEMMEEGEPVPVTAPVAVPVTVSRLVGKKSPKVSWWRKLLFEPDDQRWGERKALPGLVVYFFTGGAPTAHRVQDISKSGLFVLTSERWYLGTYVRLTLTDEREPNAERSITLYAKVVRSTYNGVGLEFLLNESNPRLRDFAAAFGQTPSWNIQEIQEFVAGFKSDS